MANVVDFNRDSILRTFKAYTHLTKLGLAASTFYRTPRRWYHTASHADKVANSAVNIMWDMEMPWSDQAAVVLAAYWHDAVYVPGAKNGVNESASASLMKHMSQVLAAKNGYTVKFAEAACIDQAAKLIEGTDMDSHMRRTNISPIASPQSLAQAVLLDADLSSMALTYREFERNQILIAKEQTGGIAPASGDASASWLEGFRKKRKHIYHTKSARRMYGEAALENIKRFVQENLDDDF